MKDKQESVVIRITENKDYKQIKFNELEKNDYFILENNKGELISAYGFDFILKALSPVKSNIYKDLSSINAVYV